MRATMRNDLKTAMRARDAVAVAALRSALAAIDNAEAVPVDHPAGRTTGLPDADGGEHVAGSLVGVGAAEVERRHVTESDVRSIVDHEVRERSDAAQEYERHGRTEAAERLRAEADVLARYLDEAPRGLG